MNVHAQVTEPEKRPVGRPSKYDPDIHPKQAAQLCEFGATDQEIANFFEIDVATIYRWQQHHLEFCDALKVGKDACDSRVERSLYAKAIGYDYTEDKIIADANGVEQIVQLQKHIPADTTSQIFWLKNRKRADWADSKRIDHTGGITHQHELRDISRVIMEILEEAAQAEAQPVIEHQEE